MFFIRKSKMERLPVTMTGVRMGERALQIGIDDPSLASAIAAKVGLSGHAAIAVSDDPAAAKARAAAATAGILVDVRVTPFDSLPFPGDAFDAIGPACGGRRTPTIRRRRSRRDAARGSPRPARREDASSSSREVRAGEWRHGFAADSRRRRQAPPRAPWARPASALLACSPIAKATGSRRDSSRGLKIGDNACLPERAGARLAGPKWPDPPEAIRQDSCLTREGPTAPEA